MTDSRAHTLRLVGHDEAPQPRHPITESNAAGVITDLRKDWRMFLEADGARLMHDWIEDDDERQRAIEWWEANQRQAIENTAAAIQASADESESQRDLFHQPLTANEFAIRPFLRRSRLGDEVLRLAMADPVTGHRHVHETRFEPTTEGRFLLLRLVICANKRDSGSCVRVWAEGLRVVETHS